MKTAIKDFYGRVIGWVHEDSTGNKKLTDFQGRIKGRYDKATDTTRDFYGRIVAKGDQLSMLLNS